ncbi:MAG TPA: rhodanese-like domain-containing protein [Galbitalea sp.]|jgi:thiosulfate/3-mercaptopyruvate sulfurtransferase
MTGPTLAQPLVSTQWLADYLGSDNLVLLDATVVPFASPAGKPGFLSGHEQFLVEGHIPSALFADLIEEFSDPEVRLPFAHTSATAFEAAAGALGIDNETTVIVYDTSAGQWATRLWWLFRTFGYDRVAVLDGGYKKWLAEGRDIETGHREPTPATFVANERPELWVTKDQVRDIADEIKAGTFDGALVCALPGKEFSGEEGFRARRGHIPGSSNVPAAELSDRETNALRSEADLRAAFGSALDADRIVLYCAAGILATKDALALTLLGAKNVTVYDNSLTEWSADESLPIATLV